VLDSGRQDLPLILENNAKFITNQVPQSLPELVVEPRSPDDRQDVFALKIMEEDDCPCSKKPSVLIVEDNTFNIFTLRLVLKSFAIELTDMALNGQEAVDIIEEKIRSHRDQCSCDAPANGMYKLIFMDCNMPLVDGFEATK
jgi:PleD family two-component response regulator